jgi:hypothetical protein
MIKSFKRTLRIPWNIGIYFIPCIDIVFNYDVATRVFKSFSPIILGIMVIIPGFYLALMSLVSRSQD